MRKGFTKIPNSLLDQPWAKNPTVVYLYTWLAINADADGKVALSLSSLVEHTGLSKKQVRGSLEKLVRAQFVAQLRAQLGAHSASVLTICHIDSYKDEKIGEGTVKGIVKGTIKGTQKEVPPCPPDKESSPKPLKEINPPISPQENYTQKRARKTFVKPTVEEVAEYISKMGYDVDAEYFWNYYEANGWVQGKNCKPIKSWKSCVTTWIRNPNKYATTRTNQRQQEPPTNDELRQQTVEFLANREAQRRTREGEIWR